MLCQVTAAAGRQRGACQHLAARARPIVQHMGPHLLQELAVLPAGPAFKQSAFSL